MTRISFPDWWAVLIIERATEELQWVMIVSPSLIILDPISEILSIALRERSTKSSALVARDLLAESRLSPWYLMTILMALDKETAVGLVLSKISAAFWTSELN